MDAKLNFRQIMSLVLICFVATAFGQETKKKKSIGDAVYQEYQQSSIDSALSLYQNLKFNKSYEVNEGELNSVGYQLMNEDGDLNAAEKIFKLNIEEYSEAANPLDSYADYLIKKGDFEEAKKYLQKSIAQNEKNNLKEEKGVLQSSKAKLAKLENKHKQLDFLVGNWNVDVMNFAISDSASYSGIDEIVIDESTDIVTVNHKDRMGSIVGKRILVYDALDEEYDVAYIDTSAPLGMYTSKMKVKDLGNGEYELIEEYVNAQGIKSKSKHELKRIGDDQMDWIIYDAGENEQDWKKVYAMDMTKKK